MTLEGSTMRNKLLLLTAAIGFLIFLEAMAELVKLIKETGDGK